MLKNWIMSTNYGVTMSYQKTKSTAKDVIKHFGQGEKILFDLYAYFNDREVEDNEPSYACCDISYGYNMPSNDNKFVGTFLYWMDRIHKENPRARFRLSANKVVSL